MGGVGGRWQVEWIGACGETGLGLFTSANSPIVERMLVKSPCASRVAATGASMLFPIGDLALLYLMGSVKVRLNDSGRHSEPYSNLVALN